MRNGVLHLLTALLACSSAVQASDISDAFYAALASKDGLYNAELNGEFGKYTRSTLKTSSKVFVSVSTLKEFKQSGCKRLRAVITAPQVTWVEPKTGQPTSFSYQYEMNLCPDGSPAFEAMVDGVQQ